MIEALKRRDCF